MIQYKTYKESNTDWIGKVPEHWTVFNLNSLVNLSLGENSNVESLFIDSTQDFPFVNSGDIHEGRIRSTFRRISFENLVNNPIRLARKGTVIVVLHNHAKLNNRVALMEIDAISSASLGVIVPKNKILNKYILYCLKAILENGKIYSYLNEISIPDLGNIKCPVPSLEEQNCIANYLDYKTRIIRSLIEKKRILAKELTRKKDLIVNDILTNGLRSNYNKKYSKIKWLGNIPEDWKLLNISSIAAKRDYSILGGHHLSKEEFTDNGIRIIQAQNIDKGNFNNEHKYYATKKKADELLRFNIYPDDLIISKFIHGDLKACLVPDLENRYLMASDFIRFEVDKNICLPKFLEYVANSKYFNTQAKMNGKGLVFKRIGISDFKRMKVLLPSLREQEDIVTYLNKKTEIIDESLRLLKVQIEKLKSYRQSLINEAVTGKIDVRNLVEKLNEKE